MSKFKERVNIVKKKFINDKKGSFIKKALN